MKEFIFKSLKIFLSIVILGTLLMIGVYMLPTNRVENNVRKSTETLASEGDYKELISGDITTMLDNYTDSIMINEAMYHGEESVINKAMMVYKYASDINDEQQIEGLVDYFDEDRTTHSSSYERYWHGYLVFIKPLLMVLDINGIRYINSFIQLALIATVSILFVKKKKENFLVPYLITIFMTTPMTVGMSLQLSTIFYIMNISLLIMLLYDDKIRSNNNYIYFFLIVGMITSYFDFLTYPIASLGLPLILYFVLKNNDSFKDNFIDLVKNSFMWACGYFGMWASKFIIGTVLTGTNVFKSAFNAVELRTSHEAYGMSIKRMDAVERNLDCILNKPFIIVFILGLLFVGYLFYKNRKEFNKNHLLKLIPFILIGCMPLAWYYILSNHSFVHSFLSYRGLVVLVFGILCGLVLIAGGNNETKKKRK